MIGENKGKTNLQLSLWNNDPSHAVGKFNLADPNSIGQLKGILGAETVRQLGGQIGREMMARNPGASMNPAITNIINEMQGTKPHERAPGQEAKLRRPAPAATA